MRLPQSRLGDDVWPWLNPKDESRELSNCEVEYEPLSYVLLQKIRKILSKTQMKIDRLVAQEGSKGDIPIFLIIDGLSSYSLLFLIKSV